MYKLSNASLAQMRNLAPKMHRVVTHAIGITAQDFSVHDGPRTAAEQNALYQQGRSKPGKKVTSKDGYRNKSNHQVRDDTGYGNAVDLVPYVPGRGMVWDWDLIYPIAVAMSQAAQEQNAVIKWGGNWYDTMDEYPSTLSAVKEAVQRYKVQHPGDDFIDGPHFELIR